MKKKMIFISLLFTPFSLYANEESNALKACGNYIREVKSQFPKEVVFSCKLLNRSAPEWDCLYEKRFSKNWTYYDGVNSCFKNIPGIRLTKEHNPNIDFKNIKASESCKIAIDLFQKYDPKEDLGFIKNTCDYPERTATQWTCMATFAAHKNSYSYSAGQCFPRK